MIDVYGTLGPACASKDTLREMFLAGMTGVRLNLSHSSLRESEARMEMIRAAAREAGVDPRILIDLQGPELRIGQLEAGIALEEMDDVLLMSDHMLQPGQPGICPGYDDIDPAIPVIPVPWLVMDVLEPYSEILLDDGRILVQVSEAGEETATAIVLRGGILKGRKSIKVVGARICPPAMTEADRQNIRDASSFGVTGVMQPFVRGRSDLETVRQALRDSGAEHLQLVAKIENRDGIDHLPDLLPACDAICIARGDLGNDMDLWQLPAIQKKIAAACRASGKYFLVATQMLSSMENSAVPTRAEVNDIFNTVADGASGVMVTGETAVGRYPVEVIRYLARTAREGEIFREMHYRGPA